MGETITELQDKRKYYWRELQLITYTMKGLEETLGEIRKQHKEALDNYSRTDHDLALIDGRAQRVSDLASANAKETKGWKKRIKTPPSVDDLTQEQIDELLAELDPQSIHVVPLPEEIDQNELADETDQLGSEDDALNSTNEFQS